MNEQREPIIRAAVRNFFVGFAIMLGVFFALFIFIAAIAAINMEDKEKYDSDTQIKILADADGNIKKLGKKTPVILQVDIKGVIGIEKMTMAHVKRQLIESHYGDLKDRVKGILLYIQSPGGTVIDADGIYNMVKEYKKKYQVPVYAYVDGMCASGGFYIAVAADKIYASDSSLIGSVGVILPTFLNISEPLQQYGIQTKTLKAGKGKDQMNPLRPWGPDESKSYQEIVDYYYRDFVEIVTGNRPDLDKEKLINDYGAQVFPAPLAKERGYIDETGMSRADALRALTRDAGIEEEDKYQVVRLDSEKWFNELFKSQLNLLRGEVRHRLELPGALDTRLQGQFLYLYQPSL